MIKLQQICTALIFSAFLSSCSAKTNFDNVAREMVIILQNGHYAKLSFDDKMSERILDDYIDFLDPQHLYFTQPQVEAIRESYATELDNVVFKAGAMKPAKEIFNLFLDQVEKRVDYSLSLLDKKSFTFDSNAEILLDREDAKWPSDEKAAQDLWALHIEEAVLAEVLRRESIEKRAAELNKEADSYLATSAAPYSKVRKRYERILRTYRESDDEDIANYFLSTIASAYDPHSDYYSKRETDEFRSSIANSLVGIGALLSSEDDGATKIKGIVINGPAYKQGDLKLNDRIVGVAPLADGDMIDILHMPLNKVVSNIRGKQNTKVTLKVEPANGAPGETKLITISRETVELKEQMASAEVFQLLTTQEGLKPRKLGWLKIPSFYKDFQEDKTSVARDVKAILERMENEDVDGLVIDLQGNGGGSLDEVQKIIGYFIGSGPVVQIKDSLGHINEKGSYAKKPIFTKPVIVHVDKTSASASEILAAALQDYKRAVVVGDESTFGKGTVQTPMEIKRFLKWYQDSDRAGTIKATIQKFYRISGGSTQLKGVESDIVIPSLAQALEIGERYAKHALDYDQISPTPYKEMEETELFIKALSRKSKKRINANPDYKYIKEDILKTQSRLQENKISLNIDNRRREIYESKQVRKERIKEQTKRYADLQEDDLKTFNVYRLNLEDLEAEQLPVLEKDVDTYMQRAKEALEDLDDTPDYPSNLSPAKREALLILADLVEINTPVKETVLNEE